MAIPLPRDVLDVPEPRESRAMRTWMQAITDAVAAAGGGGGGDIWRGKRVVVVLPIPSSTTLTALGDGYGAVGTSSAGTLATTNLLSSMVRYVTTCSAFANNQAGLNGLPQFWLGNAAGLGGFRVEIEFGVVTTVTTLRLCAGLYYNGGAVIPLTADPSAATNSVFLGCDAADTNLQIMHNDGSGTCTKVDLGASFPKTNDVVYRVVFTAAANATTIDYEVTRLDSAASAAGTISTDVPSNAQFMAAVIRCGNGGAGGAAASAFMRFLGENVSP